MRDEVNEKKTPISVGIGKDDMNLVEVPFALLDKRASKQQDIIRTEYLRLDKATGKLKECFWEVLPNPTLGLPTFPEEEIVIGLLELSSQQGFEDSRVYTSKCELLDIMHWPLTGYYLSRLELGLDKLSAVTIKTNDFWDNEKKQYATMLFGIIDGYKFFEGRGGPRRRKSQGFLPISFVDWNRILFEESFKKNYIKTLNTDIYFTLGSPTSKRLYRYESKYLYWGEVFKRDLYYLTFEKLGMSRNLYPKDLKKILSSVIEEHQEKRLAHIHIRHLGKKTPEFPSGYQVAITPFMKSRIAVPTSAPKEEESPPVLVVELAKRGMSEKVAAVLLQKYPERIAGKIDVFDWIKAQKLWEIKRPAAYLRRMIEEDWPPPEGFVSRAEQEERTQKAEARQQELQQQENARRVAETQAEQTRQRRREASPHKMIWEQIVDYLAERLPRQSLAMIIQPLFLAELHETAVVIDCPSQFIKEYVEEEYRSLLEEAVTTVCGEEKQVIFVCMAEEVST